MSCYEPNDNDYSYTLKIQFRIVALNWVFLISAELQIIVKENTKGVVDVYGNGALTFLRKLTGHTSDIISLLFPATTSWASVDMAP